MNETLFLILLLSIKHFIIDFPLQHKYQWSNKGNYGHPGGLLHSGLHGFGTFICFLIVSPAWAVYVAFIDAILHYHIDWAKMNMNKKLAWGPTTHEQFWWLLGFDQFLHSLTYIGLIYMATNT